MWKSGIFLRASMAFFLHAVCGKLLFFHRVENKNFYFDFSTSNFSTFHRGCGKIQIILLQAGVDIGGNVPNSVLQLLVSIL